MTSLLQSVSMFLICVVLSIPVCAQETEETVTTRKTKNHFSLTFGAAAGNFAVEATNFNTVYSNRSISKIYFAGIGTNRFYLIAKYREFFATGHSFVDNIDVVGKSEWKQKFYGVGIRLRGDEQPLYADVLYLVTKAEESISTGEPVVERLTTMYETENKGVGFAVGIAVKIIGPIGIFIEGEYALMTKKGQNPQGRANPELGGFCASAGAHFAL